MADGPSLGYVVATITAAVLGVVGAWLPWVRKRPVGYTQGEPYYTAEYVSGLDAGLAGGDFLLVFVAVAVVGVVLWARHGNRRPDLVLVAAGGLVLVRYWRLFREYRGVDRYALRIGLYLVLVGGLLFLLVGGGSMLARHVTAGGAGNRAPHE